MILFGVLKTAARAIAASYVLWVVVSTVLPQTVLSPKLAIAEDLYPEVYDLNTDSVLQAGLVSKNVYFLMAHPDDEVMFFGPTLVQLNKYKYSNSIKIVCFSNGDYDSLGTVRAQEMKRSAEIFGVDLEVLDLEDDFNAEWDPQEISTRIDKVLARDGVEDVVLVTFDQAGVSGHPNHFSLYYGALRFLQESTRVNVEKLYVLKSWDSYLKYSFNLVTNVEILIGYVRSTSPTTVLPKTLKLYNDANGLLVCLASMCSGHFSQMLYFRYIYLFFSKYLNSNELIEITRA